jgi:hypothetical protein
MCWLFYFETVTVTRILPSKWKQTPINLSLESTLFVVCIFLGQKIDFHLRNFCILFPLFHHIFYIFHNWRYMILLPKILKLLYHIIFWTIHNCVMLFHFPNSSVPAVHNSQDRPEIYYQRTARGEQSVSAWSYETSNLLRQHNVLMEILRPFATELTFLFSQAILSTNPNGTKHTAVCLRDPYQNSSFQARS